MKPESIRIYMNLENWHEFYNISDVDEKFNRFSATLVNLLHQCLPELSIKIYQLGKPRITCQIKREIKMRQPACTGGDTVKYEEKSEKVSGLVSKAKHRYYRSKTEIVRRAGQAKWYKAIDWLAAAEEPRETVPTPQTVGDIAETLQIAFSRP